MRAIVARIVSFPCYWLGHFVSRTFLWFEAGCFMYPVYHHLMCWSSGIEEWSGIEFMWRKPDADF